MSGHLQVAPATGGLSRFRDTCSHETQWFGGLTHWNCSTVHRDSCLCQLSYGDEEDAAIVSNPAVHCLMSYKYNGSIMSSRKGLVEDLHKRLDTRSLQGYEKVPAVNSWLDHAPTNLAGYNFQEAVGVHLGCTGTPSRLSRGGRLVDIFCKCGSNAPMSLPHITQACGIISGLQTKWHDDVVLGKIMKGRKFDVVMEPRL